MATVVVACADVAVAATETNKKDEKKSFIGVPRVILKGTDLDVKSSALSSSSVNTLILSETEMVEQVL